MELIRDKTKLLHHFRKDPVLFAYHIGDLDNFFFSSCRWPVELNQQGEVEEVILIYENPGNATIMAFGLTDKFPSFLESAFSVFPDKFYCHFETEYRDIFLKHFEMNPLGMNLKMKLAAYVPCHTNEDIPRFIRLDKTHADLLEVFYSKAYPDGYFDRRLLNTGKYYGWFEEDRIASVSGVHVCPPDNDIAVLGSIATDPNHRGKGLATKLTSFLTKELHEEGRLISLNVRADNIPAIKCYKKLGFVTAMKFEDAVFEQKK